MSSRLFEGSQHMQATILSGLNLRELVSISVTQPNSQDNSELQFALNEQYKLEQYNLEQLDKKYSPIMDQISYLFYPRYEHLMRPIGLTIDYVIVFQNAIKQYQEMRRFYPMYKKEYIQYKFMQKYALLYPEDDINAVLPELKISDEALTEFLGKSPKYAHLENLDIFCLTEVPQNDNFIISQEEFDQDNIDHPELF